MEETIYSYISAFIIGCYFYAEGDEFEKYWLDNQNCYYYMMHNMDSLDLFKGKKWYLIEPVKPKGVVITKENQDLVKWIVSDNSSYDFDYADYEWDFKNHCPSTNKLKTEWQQ